MCLPGVYDQSAEISLVTTQNYLVSKSTIHVQFVLSSGCLKTIHTQACMEIRIEAEYSLFARNIYYAEILILPNVSAMFCAPNGAGKPTCTQHNEKHAALRYGCTALLQAIRNHTKTLR